MLQHMLLQTFSAGHCKALIQYNNTIQKEKRQGAEGTHSSEPQKAHPTGEFAIVA